MAIRDKTLYLEKLTVSFDGFKALDELSLYVDPGELLCIIGPNGAGKTTMMDVITGKTRPDSGTAWFGRDLDLLVDRGQVVLADAAGLMGEGRRWEQRRVLGMWPARCGRVGTDHRCVAGVGAVLAEMRRGALSMRDARPGELRQRHGCDQRKRAGQNLLSRQIFSHVELLS